MSGDIDVLINTNDSDIFKSFITKLNESIFNRTYIIW